MAVTRRVVLTGLGAGAGLLATRGLSGWQGQSPRSFDATLAQLVGSLSDYQRARVLLPADHPSRQIDNTIAVIERPHIGSLLSPRQLSLVWELCDGMLSERGRSDFAGTFAFEGRLEGSTLAIYGDLGSAAAQVAISGGHLLLRGGAPIAGSAFGGPIAYGQQLGNERWRIEGNAFAPHGDAANRLFARLSDDERTRAVLPEPPHELVVQPQGAGGHFPGVRLGGLSDAAQEAARDLLATVFGTFPDGERSEAMACIAATGGLESLHFSTFASRGFYADMQRWSDLEPAERSGRRDPYWQVWRLEGPGTIVHFKGYPHLHAYVNVVRDPARARVGESLDELDATLEGEAMRGLLEAAMRRATGEALAWHPDEIPGRFCPGAVTTGMAWSLDPYGNRVAVATIAGERMAPPLRERLVAAGAGIEPGRRYRVATVGYFATREDLFGEPDALEPGPPLREAIVAHLRAGGLRGASRPA